MVRRSASTSGTLSTHRSVPSVTNRYSGRMGLSWSIVSVTAAVSTWSSSNCNTSAAAGSRLSLWSSWGTNGTCGTIAASPAKRGCCSLCLSAAASSRCRRQRRTTASCWCSTGAEEVQRRRTRDRQDRVGRVREEVSQVELRDFNDVSRRTEADSSFERVDGEVVQDSTAPTSSC